jgi:hypothetical protein
LANVAHSGQADCGAAITGMTSSCGTSAASPLTARLHADVDEALEEMPYRFPCPASWLRKQLTHQKDGVPEDNLNNKYIDNTIYGRLRWKGTQGSSPIL